jgi:DNA invertase Pin-like site-specific DNA recombinase
MARARKRTPKRTSNAPRRVAVGLCRCSTDRQDRSIAEQEAAIRAWAKQHRTRLLQVFKDEGVSGLQLSRPGLNACLDFLAKSPHKGTVVLWSRDRLVRPEDPIDGLVMERQVRYAGWELCYLTGSNATGNSLVDAILGLVEHHASGEYLRKLARDSLRNVIARLKAGDVPGGKIPYGYAKAVMDESGKIVRTIPRTAKHRKASLELTRLVLGDPDEVRAVRWIFDEYNRGWSSPSDLSDELNRRKAPCPTKRPWNKGTVRDILQNAVYVGDIVWNRETTARCVRFLDGELSQRLATHASRRTGQRVGSHHPPRPARADRLPRDLLEDAGDHRSARTACRRPPHASVLPADGPRALRRMRARADEPDVPLEGPDLPVLRLPFCRSPVPCASGHA